MIIQDSALMHSFNLEQLELNKHPTINRGPILYTTTRRNARRAALLHGLVQPAREVAEVREAAVAADVLL